jgi:DNA helicase-2/ATP-dependent DNA helicase PcrA
LQIIASAGSGKTEVVSQRVAALLASGIPPAGIVAFTFTERAAASLKSRIEQRVEAWPGLGKGFLDKLNGMFVGTIHSYCFRILQQHVPKYETYDVLDDHRLTAFLTREAYDIGICPKIDSKLFKAIKRFGSNVQVVENELLRPEQLDDPFREVYEAYLASLDSHRFLTYGQQIARAIEELSRPAVFEAMHGQLRHLIVDEYQDINPAQEELIARLAEPPVHVCVVGDDDQSIYQWRGSDVGNIRTFVERYIDVRTFSVQKNRRSRPLIISTANGFAATIEQRLDKAMEEHRERSGVAEVVCWRQDTADDEARVIAETIVRLRRQGHRYRDIAILCRGRVSFPKVLAALRAKEIPVQPGGRTNLFLQPEAELFGRTMCWLAGEEWRIGEWGWNTEVDTIETLTERYRTLYELDPKSAKRVAAELTRWKASIIEDRPANLIKDFYELLGICGVDHWSYDELTVNRLGTLARCSQVLVDYEQTRRRTRPDHAHPGEMDGGLDRGLRYYRWLSRYINNWAIGAYEDFEGEEDVELDAVDLTTIHQAKGLEWPVVFVPALTSLRFPTSMTGSAGDWLISGDLFNRARYEGSINDERRLFYVAITRARDWLSLSTFDRITNMQSPSPFLTSVCGGALPRLTRLPSAPKPESRDSTDEILEITFSDLAAYRECGLAYRLRRSIGFQPPIVPELGYGKAVHHVLRQLAEYVRRTGKPPTQKQLDRIFADEFYLPAARRAGYRQMRDRARELVERYLREWESDLHHVWAVERSFELHFGDATISGRADVIIKQANGGPEVLSIVDYKTAADNYDSHDFQLQVYTDAGRREGLIVDGAFVHDLKNAERITVPVGAQDIEQAELLAGKLLAGLRQKDYTPKPEHDRCARCDVRALCKDRA